MAAVRGLKGRGGSEDSFLGIQTDSIKDKEVTAFMGLDLA